MLSVSQGFPVPDVTTKVYAEADKLLRALGLIPQRLDESSTAPRDTVFKQDPAPPQFVAGGETVKLSVSKGT
jgi:beta-lactam-binding protein with PASTA domain